ncbi:MAG: DUF4347 domain-containing protein [Methylococcaceae bacterium]|nr:DUF4347 domain-containing protein [Methylococcaceae bacterium]
MKLIKTAIKERGQIDSTTQPALNGDTFYKPRLTMLALEPRIMFDGAAVATAVDATADPAPVALDAAAADASKLAEAAADAAPPAVQADPAPQPQRTEVVFIENSANDYQTLIDGVSPSAEVHVLDYSQDGLAQMAQILQGRSAIDALHIVSHGCVGSVGLGSLQLTAQNLPDHAADLATIGNALTQNGDILLYGCDVAEGSDGVAVINALAQTTQADIAASDNATGAASLGGDWQLEFKVGSIETDSSVLGHAGDQYDHLLASIGSQTIADFNARADADLGATITENNFSFAYTAGVDTIWGQSGKGISGSVAINLGGANGTETLTITQSTPGTTFKFTSFYFNGDGWGHGVITITGKLGGSTVGSQTINTGNDPSATGGTAGTGAAISAGVQTMGANSNATTLWNVDTIIITSDNYGFNTSYFDNFVFDPAVLPGPTFTSGTTANFAENATGTVYMAAATASGGTVSYSLTGGSDQARFNIDSSSGALTFLSSPNFESPTDAGTNNVYDVTITATDSNGTATQNVAVTVTNVNEAPSITSATTASFAENGTGTVYTATGTDPDSGQTLAWSIGGTDAALFSINSSTGVLTFNGAPNFEAPGDSGGNNVYDITVTATDNGSGNLTASQALAITVNDVNEAPVNTKPATQTTNEDTALVFSAGNGNDLSVTDQDAGTTLTTVVSVAVGKGTLAVTTGGGAAITGDGGNSVQIVGTVAQVQAALAAVTYTPTANANGASYATLTIASTDNGTGTLSDTDTVTIDVTAVADTPSITGATTTPSTQTTGGLVISRNAADGAEVTYFKITNIANGTLYKNDGSTQITANSFITFAEANAGLKFTPSGASDGTFDVQASTSNADGGLGGGVVTATVSVGVGVGSPTVNEDTDTGAIAIAGNTAFYKITGISGGTLYSNAGYSTAIGEGGFIATAGAATNVYFRPTADFNGVGGFSVQGSSSAFDAGLTGNTAASVITVTAIADTPAVASPTVNEDTDTGAIVITRNPADGAETTHYKITGITGGTLYSDAGYTTQINGNDFIASAGATTNVYFRPTANRNSTTGGNGGFTVQASKSNLDAGLGGSTATSTVTLTPVADTPSVASPTINEDTDSGAIAITRNAADGAEVSHYKITGISGGTLYSDAGYSTMITDGGFITSGGATTNVYFRPTANSNTAGSFTIQASTDNADSGLGGSTATSTVSITPIADTPSITGTSTTPSTQTSGGLVVSRNVVDGAEVTYFKITNITNGTLYLNDGTTQIVNNDFVSYAAAHAGFKFTPSGASDGSFDLRASTSSNDGGLGGSAITATVSVGVGVASPTINEDANSGAIAIGGNTAWYKITGISGGTLYSDAGYTTTISEGGFIATAGAATNVYFRPTADFNGAAGFSVQGSSSAFDAGLTSNTAISTITVTAVNDAPTLSSPASLSVTEDVASVITGISFADIDAGSGAVTATLAVGSGSLTATSGGGVTVAGGGTATMTLTGSVADINDFISANGLSFITAANATSAVTLGVSVNDGGNSGSGGALGSGTNNVTLNVTAVNDAPTITAAATAAFAGTNENTASAGVAVNTILTGAAAWVDPDGAGVNKGIAVTATVGNGNWQYSTDGTVWTDFGAVSAGSALLLDGASQIRYLPDSVNGETATFSYRAWDETTGTASSDGVRQIADPGAGGGSTAFSANGAGGSIVVGNVNDAPTGLGSLTLAATNEDTSNPAGTAINALTGYSFQDVDAGATSPGVLVVGNAANAVTEGVWQYSSDGGANWKAVGAVTDGANALALSSATQLRFVPVANYNGTPSALSIRALDNTYVAGFSTTTGGTEIRVTADSSTNGATTAISANLNIIDTGVTAVNDMPAFTKGGDQVVNEDAGAQTVASWTTGLSAGAANESGQVLSFVASNNNNALFSVQPTIDGNGNLSYTPAANASGVATVTVFVRDNGGTANGGVDTSATQTFTITVNPVNDLPSGTLTINGTLAIGDTLTVANSLVDVEGMGAVSYQWQADGADINAATGDRYVLTQAEAGKLITVVAHYTDGQGTAESVASAAIGPVGSTAINLSQITGNADGKPGSDAGVTGVSGVGNQTLTGNDAGPLNDGGLNNSPGVNHGFGDSFAGNDPGNSGHIRADTVNFNTGQTLVVDMRLNADAGGNGLSGGTLNIPSSAFAGLDRTGVLTITASQASGQSLPSWISVNPSTGAVTVKEGAIVANPITVKVVIRDSQGKQSVVLVKIQPRNGRLQNQRDNTENHQFPAGDGQQGQGRGRNVQGQREPADNSLAQSGKPGLTRQLQMVGSKGFEHQRLRLLDSLASIGKNNQDAA